MSIATIDPQTYDNILTRTIAHFIDSGMDLIAARQLAKEQMASSFVKGDDRDRDWELDYKENGIYG
jgi:hypothetical protein